VAPDAELIVARVLDGDGGGRTSHVMAGIEWAVEQGARVINVSLGGPPYPSDGTDAFSALCNAAVNAGAVVCVAAGNLGPTAHTVGSPAASEQVITVGATVADVRAPSDRVAPFSSRGPTADGRLKPDVVFPGTDVTAARAAGTSLGTIRSAHYTSLSGTSQATPMAAGTVALLLQANPRLQPEDIKTRLRRGARRLADADPAAQGSGRGDAYNTFVAAEGTPVGTEPVMVETPPQRRGCMPLRALTRK
jgi:serine protease AprX